MFTDPDNNNIIQLFVDNRWVHLCGKDFNAKNAAVACNQMGYKPGDSSEDVSVALDAKIYKTWVFEEPFYCTGLETKLIDCGQHEIYVQVEENTKNKVCTERNRSIYIYAAVNCSNEEISCVNGDVQHNGEHGVFEICAYGDWHRVCGDPDSWNNADAQTACRNLGENPDGARAHLGIQSNDDDDLEIFKVAFHCVGDEEKLQDCPRTIFPDDHECQKYAVADCGSSVNPPLNADFSIVINSRQLMVSWTGAISNELYHVTCTETSTESTLSAEQWNNCSDSNSDHSDKSMIIKGFSVDYSSEYYCCLTAIKGEIESEPVCQLIESLGEKGEKDFLNDFGPWVFGSLAGLMVGVIVALVFCSCVVLICRMKHTKHQANHSNNTIPSTTPSNDGGDKTAILLKNSLYHTDNRTTAELKYRSEHMSVSLDSIPTYHTIDPTDHHYSKNNNQYALSNINAEGDTHHYHCLEHLGLESLDNASSRPPLPCPKE